MKILKIIELIKKEYFEAERKFPAFNSSHEGYAIILEELDELWDEIKANNKSAIKFEAIKVAAMALRFLIDILSH